MIRTTNAQDDGKGHRLNGWARELHRTAKPMRYHIDDIVLHHESQSVFAGEVQLARSTLAVLGEIVHRKRRDHCC